MIIDIIILIILVSTIFLGVKKGLISCVIDFLAVIIALILAIMLCRPLTNVVIEKTEFDDNLKQIIINNIPLNQTDFKVEDSSNLPVMVQEYINNITKDVNTSKDEVVDVLSTEITTGIITLVVFIAIFIIVRFVLILFKIVSKIIDKIPGLKQINKLGGAVCGALQGIIIIYVALAMVSMISPIIQNKKILEQINNSNIGSIMYNNNYILKTIYK